MKRVDANQSKIVKELRQLGYSVLSIADMGDGCPDIIVGASNGPDGRPFNALIEIKNWRMPPSARRLTPKEKQFHSAWKGQIAVCETTEEVLRILCK